jgi:hypothetical protein
MIIKIKDTHQEVWCNPSPQQRGRAKLSDGRWVFGDVDTAMQKGSPDGRTLYGWLLKTKAGDMYFVRECGRFINAYDKEGNEIYEGDILEYDTKERIVIGHQNGNCELLPRRKFVAAVIIGNIIDNHNLIVIKTI